MTPLVRDAGLVRALPRSIWAVALLSAGLAGCGGPKSPPGTADAPVPEAPSYRELAAAQNRRANALARLHADGVITLRWTDDRGRHQEQANVELLTNAGNRVALRVHKAAIGEEFLWLGSDGDRCWLFDVRDRSDSVVYLGRQDERQPFGAEAPLDLGPTAMLDLLGVSPLPEPAARATGASVQERSTPDAVGADDRDPSIGYDRPRDAWIVVVPGRSGMMRMFLERRALLPVRVECLSPQLEILVHSDLPVEGYESVELDGVPPGAYPRLPMQIRLGGFREEDDAVAITFGHASGRADDVKPKVFDLDILLRRFQPARIREVAEAVSERDAKVPALRWEGLN